MQQARELSVLRYGSPNFRHTFGAIAAGANEFVGIRETFPRSRKYEPLNTLVVTNTSGENVDLFINGTNFMLIPAGVITSITDEAVWTMEIQNNDTTNVAAGEIRANLSRPPLTADEFYRLGLQPGG
jgi:hypothetical protein